MPFLRSTVLGGLERWASGLRFPWLLALVAALFVADVVVPDMIPFVDEILLGLATVALARIRRGRADDGPGEGAGRPDEPVAPTGDR